MYDAMDIAEYVLCYCNEKLGESITNLQLQKFLYYIQGKCIAKLGEAIFDNKIEAWQYGPVIPDVYFWFNKYMSEPITDIECNEKLNLSKDEKKIIENVIDKKILLQPWELVKQTHEESPWIDNYVPNMNFEITIDDLKKFFKKS